MMENTILSVIFMSYGISIGSDAKGHGMRAAVTMAAKAAFFAGALVSGMSLAAAADNARSASNDPSHGFYVWAEGSYQSVKLPDFSLGLHYLSAGLFGGQIQRYSPRASGAGVSGAVGYIFPNGTLPAAFGSNARLEFGVSYVKADASQSAADVLGIGTVGLRGLNGLGVVGFTCAGCTAVSTLKTDYDSRQLSLKGAGDFFTGPIQWTPSIAYFAGRSLTEQQFAQDLVGAPVNQPTNYNSQTNVLWTDFGARAGLEAKFRVTDWLTTGIGGTAGFARRSATLSGNNTGLVAGLLGSASGRFDDVNSTTTAFLASGEINLTLRPTSAMTIQTFAGLRYDNRVPGISSPSFTGFQAGPPTSTTAAGLTFSTETSYYAGGSLTVKFGP